MNNKDVYLNVGGRRKDVQISVSQNRQKDIQIGITKESGTSNYNQLSHKPQINDVTLEGNKYLMDLFPEGILINCGDSTGYPDLAVPMEEG